jgi:hypothetical protein
MERQTGRPRLARTWRSVSAVSSEAMGLPVLNTQMPSFFCMGVELRRGAQGDLVALDRKVESVAWGELQLVPNALGKDDAARSVESDFAFHDAITLRFDPSGNCIYETQWPENGGRVYGFNTYGLIVWTTGSPVFKQMCASSLYLY